MWENLGPVLIISVAVPVVGVVGWVIVEVARHWRKVRENEQLAALKQSMVERGMSAEEIERVINAGVSDPDQQVKAT
jgi:hypothetical protein